MDEEEYYDEDDDLVLEEVTYAPMSFSWRTLAHNTISSGAAVIRVGATWLDLLASQVGCSNAKWREASERVEARTQAKEMLAALDDL